MTVTENNYNIYIEDYVIPKGCKQAAKLWWKTTNSFKNKYN